jgi:mono/diheme cytochrome c family protein
MRHRVFIGWNTTVLALAMTACSSTGSNGSPGGGSGNSGSEATAGNSDSSASGGKSASGGNSAGSTGGSSAPNAGSGTGGQSGGAGSAGHTGPDWDWHAYVDDTPATLGTAERGQYLIDHVLVCGVCHTPSMSDGTPDTKNYLAGSRPFDFTDIDGTVITVNAENLTDHDPEGLHTWTDGQIRVAVTEGVDDEHYAIYPIMPYPEYSLLKPEDVDSIIKYLRTVPANDNVVASDYPRPDIHPPAAPVDESKIPHTTLASSDPDYAAAERGRYLASVACLNCHTEEVVRADGMIDHDNPNLAKAFAGGKQYTFEHDKPKHTSVNITPDATGLADWTIDDIVSALKTDTEKGTGRTLCNTHPSQPDRLGGMTDGDMRDIATYIHTLPPVKNGPFKCMQ